MAFSEEYVSFVNEQLSNFDGIYTKKMFGGIGYYNEGVMFGLLGNDIFCLRVTDENRADYEKFGMRAFMSSETTKGLPYYEVPAEILEDRDALVAWAKKASEIAITLKK